MKQTRGHAVAAPGSGIHFALQKKEAETTTQPTSPASQSHVMIDNGGLEKTIQPKSYAAPATGTNFTIQKKENKTGLPDQLKSGIENLSGHSMDDVNVHYNSAQPAQLNAHAYAQGNQIHIAPGQEKHLAHEAWHVVQQKQGRVKPNKQLKSSVAINDDAGLEKEADVMGAKAMLNNNTTQLKATPLNRRPVVSTVPYTTIQRQIQLADSDDGLYEETEAGKTLPQNTELYFCEFTVNGKPVFVQQTDVDELESELNGIETSQLAPGLKLQAVSMAYMSKAIRIHYYNDDGDVTDLVNMKHFRLQQALNHPLVKDPNRAHGLQHRFADADGVLFSKLTKAAVEAKIGALPATVTFHQIPDAEWKEQVLKHRDFWTEVSADYAYGRHMDKRGITARNDRSKFRNGNTTSTDHEDFNNEDYTASLPPVGPAQQISAWFDHKRYVNAVKRGKGQYVAMGKWNALAYAAYWYHHAHGDKVVLGQDWEWLHVQGAQNGGATNMSNLVAGTSTTNSRMIPWEDSINAWTNKADATHPLSVRYSAERIPNTNLGKKIEIDIAAENGIPGLFKPVSKASPMHLIFHPLNGTVYDKVSNKITDTAVTKEALDDTFKRTQIQTVRNYVASNEGRVKRLVVIYQSPYKGFYVEFKRFYNADEALVVIEALHKQAVVPIWGLKPLS